VTARAWAHMFLPTSMVCPMARKEKSNRPASCDSKARVNIDTSPGLALAFAPRFVAAALHYQSKRQRHGGAPVPPVAWSVNRGPG
jgi:hypothetical protein